MRSTLRTLALRQLRRLPVVLGLLAVTMQVALPVVHGWSETVAVEAQAATSPVLQASGDRAATTSHHDAATCPECRVVSQLRALTPVAKIVGSPLLRSAWIASSVRILVLAQVSRDTGAPRAPPFLA